MTTTLLIANRGEIARRINRTAHAMGMRTVAVYSDADRGMPHMRETDEAIHIGPSPAAESYLVIDRIIAAAQQSGATLIHPGYGFLSENTDFSQACDTAGITFVGPPASAIEAMGLKDGAKRLMAEAGVPVVPGYHGADQNPDVLKNAADDIGYPVLIKAVAGGGGKGMRKVEASAEFADQLAACKGEAKRAFGNDDVLIEKFVSSPRHVEVQVFSDTHGNHVHLFDRDCSIQRRHQKIVEEAPAPGIPDAVRAKMYAAAVQAAKSIDYVGAGTIEFILDAETFDFYFMEMNTRLQVEHPVTEEITGVDLVEWQLRVAMGEPIPLAQNEIAQSGHAIEVRLYAEDPDAGFLPSTGQLDRLSLAAIGDGVRIESGVESGNQISPFYDPMIAKLITAGASRAEATRGLIAVLDASIVEGVKTNRAFLARTLSAPAFAKADLTTAFLETNASDIEAPTSVPSDIATLAAEALVSPAPATQHATLWSKQGATRLNGSRALSVSLAGPNGEPQRFSVGTNGRWLDDTQFGTPTNAKAVVVSQHSVEVRDAGQTYSLSLPESLHGKGAAQAGQGAVIAPMPGNVLSVAVTEGAQVETGQTLMVLEAMKMEHRMAAPKAGLVKALHVSAGAQVKDGDILIEIGEDE
ncbi:MAG: acetyl/propionyl/methylcrotonyl-CoA carboxylase subunit alpha [Pseudomonadota bacterium]